MTTRLPVFALRRSFGVLLLSAVATLVSAQTATDACTYSVGNQYTVGASCSPQTFNKPNTFTATYLPTGCGASANNDAWGWFTATATSTSITYAPGSGNPRIHLFDGACGSLNQLACINAGGNGAAETLTYATTIGVNYMIRIQSSNNNTMNGNLCIWSPPANDNPCGAVALAVGSSCTAVSGTNVSATATSGIPAPGCAAYSTADVWFSFTAPASGSINIETAAGTLTDGGVAIYSATACGGTFTLISCDDSNGPGNMGQAQASGLTVGDTYYARVWGNGGATGTFTICAYALANDNPCGATVLTVGTSCTAVSSTNVNATTTTGPPAPGCAAFSSADVWFAFVAPSTGSIALETTAGTLTDGGAAVYSATACGGTFTLLICDDNNGAGNMSLALYNGLTPGTTYYARVWGNGGATGTFNVCAYSLPNDNPCGATALTVGSSCTAVSSTNASATSTTGIPAPGCASYSSGDVWFSFVAPSTGVVTLAAEPGGLTDGGMALYSATACGGTYTLIECDDNDGTGNMPRIARTGLTAGQTYYVRMWGNGGATGTFTICAFDPSLVNDNPCGAIGLAVNSSCSNTAGTTVSATNTTGPPAPTCANYSGSDVWFTIVAPASGSVNIETSGGTINDSGLALYSATACGGTFTQLACNDDNGVNLMSTINQTGLTPGTTYYVRVWRYGGGTGTFNICAWEPPPPPANDNPCGAIALAVNTSCTTTSATNIGAVLTAGIPNPGCGNTIVGDVWFAIVAPANEFLTLRITPGTMTDPAMALYSAPACGGAMTLMQCDDNLGLGNEPFLTFTPGNLVAGQTYYLRVWNATGSQGTFNLCAFTTGASCFVALRLFDDGNNGWGGSRVTVQVGAAPAVNYTLTTEGANIFYIPFTAGQLIQVSYATMGAPNQGQIYYFLQIGSGILFSGGPNPAAGLVYAALPSCGSIPPPASDCSGGDRLCTGTSFTGSPSNTGTIADLNFQTRGCLAADERQGNWYHFIPSASGTIGMTIAPSDPADDYDFAIWGPAITKQCPPNTSPYRCSFSGDTGNTGLGNGASDTSEDPSGDKWVSTMPVLVGEVYTMYISNFSRSGLAFNLSWQFGGGADISCLVLPVEWLSFEGRPVDRTAELEWVTATETGSSHYIVERSSDGYTFEAIGQLPAAGNSYSTLTYRFTDAQPERGLNYYRIKQVDLDGSTDLSEVVTLPFDRAVDLGKPYPNPTADRIAIDITVEEAEALDITVLDASGRLVRTFSHRQEAGTHPFVAPVGDLEPGAYHLLVTDSQGETTNGGRFIVE